MIDNVKYFWENYDWDMLMEWMTNADPVAVITNPWVLGPIILILAMIGYSKTSEIGQMAVLYVPFCGFLFVTATLLKNDSITNTGPFVFGMLSFFGVIGWLIWTQLLKN